MKMVNLEKNEALVISGKNGRDASIALSVIPLEDTTIVLSDAKGRKVIQPMASFQKVGKFPCEVRITFLFDARPWKVEIGFPKDYHYNTSSSGRGLEDKILLTPDILQIGIIFKEEETT
jgi:hypothetical protein